VGRPQSRYICQACGTATLRWEGQCRSCGAWNTLVETIVREEGRAARSRRSTSASSSDAALPVAIGDLREPALVRIPVGIGELDRVLGGGLVPGSLVLLGGEPGIGKSTLALEAAAGVAAARAAREAPVIYVSGEESAGQVRLRAQRVGLIGGAAADRVAVLAETELETILQALRSVSPSLVVVDSIQTLTVDGLDGPAGSVGQVREAAGQLLRYAKDDHVPVLLVGHVTKDGSLAGPKALEHLVDVVLTLEGERVGPLRLLRATKNRFGSTDEIGVFEMAPEGLREVSDPARAFLGPSGEPAPGAMVAATLEGRRPLLVEVQALVAPAGYGPPRRAASGLDQNRLSLLLAVLGKRAGVGLGTHDVYASLAGGLTITEPALDLPLAVALTSSLRDRPAVRGTVACGEVGLLGELRPVAGLDRRLREAERLGFRRAIVPPGDAMREVGELQVVRCATLREALDASLEPAPRTASDRSVRESRARLAGTSDHGPGPGADSTPSETDLESSERDPVGVGPG
jgi:DNA repair protein RadA/Sms